MHFISGQNNINISDLHIYPVKSCRSLGIDTSGVEERGLLNDRRAMLVNEDGVFLSLRSHPNMSGIRPSIKNGRLFLNFDGELLEAKPSTVRITVRVWRDVVITRIAQKSVNARLSKFLGQQVRLVFMDQDTQRRVKPEWSNSKVSLADGSPISVVNTASLARLSEIAGREISMCQFRPNITLRTNEPWAEDCWKTISVGTTILELIKPIDRCKIVTLDPESGDPSRMETMKALIHARKSGDGRVKGVLFGWAAIVRQGGEIAVGDNVDIVNTREAWPILDN